MGQESANAELAAYAVVGDDGDVKGLFVLRDWDHAETFADLHGWSVYPLFYGDATPQRAEQE